MSITAPETHTFQAEVKQVLDIVIHSLYTDKEIFIRELVSNASDALEKLRHTQMTGETVFDDNLPLEINITTDDTAGTLTIQDFGIGMTHDELVENLGTIAHSGSKAFLQAIKESGKNNDNLIGQFGVGFYSAFMVADDVRVYTRTWRSEGEGLLWTSDGSGSYTIEPSEGQRRGAKVVIKLKEEHKDFAKADTVKTILQRYSSYVPFPVNLNGEKINTMQAIWLQSKNEVTEEQYKAFYAFQAKAFDQPLGWMHFSADAPLSINALLYIPGSNTERFGFGRMEPAVALHCRKILIDAHPKNLLPEWLRFLKGVVDSADLPLNISRESMQDSALVQKLNKVITKRFIKYVEDLAKKDAEKFKQFWSTFGIFLKEGVSMDHTHRDAIAPLLRFESSATEKGEHTSLDLYVDRMKPDQKTIYYLMGRDRTSIENGPYLEAFRQRGLEVLFLYEPIDDFVMNHLGRFKDHALTAADQADLDLGEAPAEADGEALDKEALDGLCGWLKSTYPEDRVGRVSSGQRLVDSPVVALNADKMMSASMRRMMKAMHPDEDEPMAVKVDLEINPRHPLIKNLATLRGKDADLAQLVAAQLLDNALIGAGMLDNPRDMTQRLYTLLERVSQS